MKLKVVKFIGANTVVGKTTKGLVRARVAVNKRPAVGDEIERPDSEVAEYKEPKEEKAETPATEPAK